jgi:hypothetical protein
MSKNHFDDFKNLKNHTSQHYALKIVGFVENVAAYFLVILSA